MRFVFFINHFLTEYFSGVGIGYNGLQLKEVAGLEH